MGVTGFSEEIVTKVPAPRLFQAGVVDLHKLAPLAVPDTVSSASLVQGDGGVGSIRQFNFTNAVHYNFVKERIDLVNKEAYEYKYTLVEGGDLGKKFQSETIHFKLVPSSDGGSVIKVTAQYETLPGVEFTEADIKAQKEETVWLIKAVEEYLLANPTAHA